MRSGAPAPSVTERGRLGPACGKLDTFIGQVITTRDDGKLTAEIAAILISGANALKVSYGGP